MIRKAYLTFCETLWSDWLSGKLDLSSDLRNYFQADYAPEPYLQFGEGRKPLYVLFTNPGEGLPRQHHRCIRDGKSCVRPTMSYKEASSAFANSYLNGGISKSAKRRIDALEHIKQLCDADCIVQFESLPFHSGSLPGKDFLPELVKSSPCLAAYVSHLAEALSRISVVALSAVSTAKSISKHTIRDSKWLSWQATKLLGMNPEKVERATLVKKANKITSAFLYQRVDGCVRGIVVTMGGNNFPGSKGREVLARLISG